MVSREGREPYVHWRVVRADYWRQGEWAEVGRGLWVKVGRLREKMGDPRVGLIGWLLEVGYGILMWWQMVTQWVLMAVVLSTREG